MISYPTPEVCVSRCRSVGGCVLGLYVSILLPGGEVMTSRAASSGRCVAMSAGSSRADCISWGWKGGRESKRRRAMAVMSFVQLASLKIECLSIGFASGSRLVRPDEWARISLPSGRKRSFKDKRGVHVCECPSSSEQQSSVRLNRSFYPIAKVRDYFDNCSAARNICSHVKDAV